MKIGKRAPIKFYKEPKTLNEVIASLESLGCSVVHRHGFGQIKGEGRKNDRTIQPRRA